MPISKSSLHVREGGEGREGLGRYRERPEDRSQKVLQRRTKEGRGFPTTRALSKRNSAGSGKEGTPIYLNFHHDRMGLPE